MSVTVFVEGGGQSKDLKTRCREGFGRFLRQALEGRMPKIVACGSRWDAFKRFHTAMTTGGPLPAVLLVDSEDVVASRTPWEHVRERSDDNWQRPEGATDEHLHFMAVCMESWLVADPESLQRFFGDGFAGNRLPGTSNLESVSKPDVLDGLRSATEDTSKGPYQKGRMSFEALGSLNIDTVRKRMHYCDRLVRRLQQEPD